MYQIYVSWLIIYMGSKVWIYLGCSQRMSKALADWSMDILYLQKYNYISFYSWYRIRYMCVVCLHLCGIRLYGGQFYYETYIRLELSIIRLCLEKSWARVKSIIWKRNAYPHCPPRIEQMEVLNTRLYIQNLYVESQIKHTLIIVSLGFFFYLSRHLKVLFQNEDLECWK